MSEGPHSNSLRGRILLVDDDFAVRVALRRALESESYGVVAVNDDTEALQLLSGERCDLVLLDLDLSEAKGWGAFDRIHSALPSLPIVLITARPDQYDAAAAAGATGIMEKPFSLPLLLDNIDKMLQELARRCLERPACPQSVMLSPKHE